MTSEGNEFCQEHGMVHPIENADPSCNFDRAEVTNAYRFHQLADLIDAFPKLNGIQIHVDGDSINFFVNKSEGIDEQTATIQEALVSWGVTIWEKRRTSNIMSADTPACGFDDFVIFAMGGGFDE